ncbi:MAG: hypothetical protein IPK01_14465 [Acidobacteria bacterium]|nr:hypothetical protein [Acidobacteriota bacterium]
MKNGKLKIKTLGSALISAHRFALYASVLLSIFHFSFSTVSAQPETVPPPSKIIAKEEKAKLESVTDEKDRTILALAFMDAHLKQAEKLFQTQDYYNLYVELGAFHYLMDNTLDYLLRRNNGSSRMRNNLKRYEIGLRGFAPRLELIRREVPPKYEPYIFKLLKNLRDARTSAIEPQFGDTVINTN